MTIHELTLNIIFAVFVFVSKRKRYTEEKNDDYIVEAFLVVTSFVPAKDCTHALLIRGVYLGALYPKS
jgi:hypothetical protein